MTSSDRRLDGFSRWRPTVAEALRYLSIDRRLRPLLLIGVAGLAGCGGSAGIRIVVNRPTALVDAPLRITVRGLSPGEHVVLRATSQDAKGTRYASSTFIHANAGGQVVLVGDAAMRPLWSLRPVGLRSGTPFGYYTPSSGVRVELTVKGARTTVRRLSVARGVRAIPVRRPFYGEFFVPPKAAKTGHPGILVFGGSEGGLSTTGIAQLYASHGYPALALAYFGEPGLPRNLVRIPLEYFASALRWLRRQAGVNPSKLVVEGISRGSEAAQLLGIHYPGLVHGVVAMVPALGAECGVTRFTGQAGGGRCLGEAAWTFRGKAIPWGAGLYNTFPFPDERIDGPILLDCAGYDAFWPSCSMAQAIVSRLHAHHFRYPVTLLNYPQAGHGVGSLEPNEIYFSNLIGGLHADSNNEAAANGWPKLLDFFKSLGSR